MEMVRAQHRRSALLFFLANLILDRGAKDRARPCNIAGETFEM